MVTGRASLFGCLIASSKYVRLCGGEYGHVKNVSSMLTQKIELSDLKSWTKRILRLCVTYDQIVDFTSPGKFLPHASQKCLKNDKYCKCKLSRGPKTLPSPPKEESHETINFKILSLSSIQMSLWHRKKILQASSY